jgi:hypothetical protein
MKHLCESNKQVGIRSESLKGVWILISMDSKMHFFLYTNIFLNHYMMYCTYELCLVVWHQKHYLFELLDFTIPMLIFQNNYN